jgi:hypothetical protein
LNVARKNSSSSIGTITQKHGRDVLLAISHLLS